MTYFKTNDDKNNDVVSHPVWKHFYNAYVLCYLASEICIKQKNEMKLIIKPINANVNSIKFSTLWRMHSACILLIVYLLQDNNINIILLSFSCYLGSIQTILQTVSATCLTLSIVSIAAFSKYERADWLPASEYIRITCLYERVASE